MNAVNRKCPPIGELDFIVGTPVNVETELRGKKPFVIELFGTWCGPCVMSIPHLSEVQRENPDITIISVSTSDRKDKLQQFARSKGNQIEYRLASDFGSEALSELEQSFRVQGIPHAFVVNHQGIIVYSGHPMDPNFTNTIHSAVEQYKRSLNTFDLKNHTKESISKLSVKELKLACAALHIPSSSFVEKSEFINAISAMLPA